MWCHGGLFTRRRCHPAHCVLQACGEELVMWMYPEERAVWRLVCKQGCEHLCTCTDGLRYDPYSSIYSYSCISRNKASAEPAQYQPTMSRKCPNVKTLSCCEAKLAGFDGLPASVAGLSMQRSMSAVDWSSLTRLVGLIHLDITMCEYLDTAQLGAAMRRLPNISTLRMQGNQLSNSSSSVQHITDALPSLTKLTKLVFDDEGPVQTWLPLQQALQLACTCKCSRFGPPASGTLTASLLPRPLPHCLISRTCGLRSSACRPAALRCWLAH